MRTEQEMFDLVLTVARQDARVRAVYMNGSRANPNAPKDIFQDYDIVYVVTETTSFLRDENWVRVFGELIMMQEPDKNHYGLLPGGSNGAQNQRELDEDYEIEGGVQTHDTVCKRVTSYGYLMLFADGNRIDLHIQTKDAMQAVYLHDKLTVPLLDKDNCLPAIPPATDVDYQVRRPSEAEYLSSCNDFWWCLQNVAKGIWRDELPYAKAMFEKPVRVQLDAMVSWWIGMQHDFNLSAGKMGKYFKKYLPENYWEMYKSSYSSGDYHDFWESIFVTCKLFRTLALEVGRHLSFSYPEADDRNMTAYLRHVRNLPADAEGVY